MKKEKGQWVSVNLGQVLSRPDLVTVVREDADAGPARQALREVCASFLTSSRQPRLQWLRLQESFQQQGIQATLDT